MHDLTPIRDSAIDRSGILEGIKDLYNYRNLVVQMVRRDIVTRYKRSVLGIFWTMLSPLGMMIILSIIFSQLMPTAPTFPVYVLSGLIAWNFFSQSSTTAVSYLLDSGSLIRNIYVPPVVFIVSGIGTGLVNLILSFIPLIIVTAAFGIPIRWSIIFIPVPVLLLAFFTLGVSLIISTMAVYFRDIIAMYQLLLTGWIYLNPILYPENLLNPNFRYWLSIFNPMYHLIRIFRIPIYQGSLPEWGSLLFISLVSLMVLIIGWVIFSRKSDEFAYRI